MELYHQSPDIERYFWDNCILSTLLSTGPQRTQERPFPLVSAPAGLQHLLYVLFRDAAWAARPWFD